jgi:hypothetical protein
MQVMPAMLKCTHWINRDRQLDTQSEDHDARERRLVRLQAQRHRNHCGVNPDVLVFLVVSPARVQIHRVARSAVSRDSFEVGAKLRHIPQLNPRSLFLGSLLFRYPGSMISNSPFSYKTNKVGQNRQLPLKKFSTGSNVRRNVASQLRRSDKQHLKRTNGKRHEPGVFPYWVGVGFSRRLLGVLPNSNSRWRLSDPLPPSAALPLTRRGRIKLSRLQASSPPREGETRAKRARGSLTRHLELQLSNTPY